MRQIWIHARLAFGCVEVFGCPVTQRDDDGWEANSVAVEPRRNASNRFQGPKIWHEQRNSQYKTTLELPPYPAIPQPHTSLFMVFSVSNSNMNSTANQYSCRLPSTSLMLFLLALLFFVLGTGTSAVKISPVPITSGLVSHEDYIRLHGYWVPTVRKHVFVNLMSYKELNLDRQREVSGILLLYISAQKMVVHWNSMSPILTTSMFSMLYAMECTISCGYWIQQSILSVVYCDLKTFIFD